MYDGLRLLLWQQGRDAAPALAAEAGALLPLLAEHLGAPLSDSERNDRQDWT